MNESLKEIESIKNIVNRLIESDDLARNSPIGSVYLVWKDICKDKGVEFNIPFSLFVSLPRPSTIVRVKRELQHQEGHCKEDEEVSRKLKELEKIYKKRYSNNGS